MIPTYNASHTIERAIRSVLNQTHPVKEIVIVDDASEDNTIQQINNTFSTSKLRIFERDTRRGPGAARDYGIDQSQGEFVALLDADDEWKEQKLELQLQFMDERNADLSTTDLAVFDKEGEFVKIKHIPFREDKQENIRGIYLNKLHNMTPTLLFKRPVFEDLGGFPHLAWKEDHLFVMRALRDHNHVHVSQPLTERHLPQSSYSRDPDRNFTAELEAYEEFNKIVVEEFPYLKEDETKYLSKLYFRMSEKINLSNRKWKQIDPYYLPRNDKIKYWLKKYHLGWTIPVLKKLKRIFFTNGILAF